MIKDSYWQFLERKLFSWYICTLRLMLDISYLHNTQYVKFWCNWSICKTDTNTNSYFYTFMSLHQKQTLNLCVFEVFIFSINTSLEWLMKTLGWQMEKSREMSFCWSVYPWKSHDHGGLTENDKVISWSQQRVVEMKFANWITLTCNAVSWAPKSSST